MTYKTIELEMIENLAVVTLNRQERLNAISKELIEEFADLVSYFESNDQIRVIIITGAGRAFCAGADI